MSESPGAGRGGVLLDSFRSQIWPLPVLAVFVAVGLGIALPQLDLRAAGGASGGWGAWLFSGGPDAARAVLTAIAGSLVTITSLTFSLTVVTLQLASGQFSPRLLRTFNQDRAVHLTLSLFLATFAYSLTVLRTVRSGDEDGGEVVPRLAVTLAFVLAVSSVLALVLFLAHLATEIRVETMLRRVRGEAEATVLRVLPERSESYTPVVLPVPSPDAVPLLAPASGFLTSLRPAGLVGRAAEHDAVVLLERPLGSSLVTGTPVGWAWSMNGTALPDDARRALQECTSQALTAGHEPTGGQDVSMGLKQLTDVAAKALSPGINDPRTAVHALGHSAALLCVLAGRQLGAVAHRDDAGIVRLFADGPDLPALLDLAVSAPRRYGAADPDVLARLFALLAELAWTATAPGHRAAVLQQLDRLEGSAGEQDLDGAERARLEELGKSVRAAARGEHRSPARALVV